MTRSSKVLVPFLAGAAITLLTPSLVIGATPAAGTKTTTAGKQIRAKLSLHVTGTYQHTGPKTFPQGAPYLTIKAALDNSYTTEYVVAAETTLTGLQKTNPLDPASQQEMDDYNAKVRARNDRIYHSADNLRGKGPGAPGGARPANPMAMMNPAMMQKIMACGQDQACKQKIAMEMMAQQQAQASGPGAQVQADIQAISNMCINEKHQKMGSKGYEDCMNAEGNKRSTVKRSAADDEPEVPELPDRYFLYRNGVADCQFRAHAKINESGTYGSISDGEGGGQYGEGSGTTKGEGNSDPKAFQPCANAQAVFDTKTNLFWGGGLHRPDVELQSTGSSHGSQESTREIDKWIASTLQGVPASGSKTQKFGYQTATLTWSFVRE
jgi:hypothetical protein